MTFLTASEDSHFEFELMGGTGALKIVLGCLPANPKAMFQLRGGKELTWDAVCQDQCSWMKPNQSKTNENKQAKTHLRFHSLAPLSRAFQRKKLEHFSAVKAAALGSQQAGSLL